MDLSLSTFALEIINFLVLVWILKRFLYKPVLNIIDQRRSNIENQIAEARNLQQESEQLKTEYENRLDDWEQERQQFRDKLMQELDADRSRQMEKLHTTLAAEREKAEVAESHRREEAIRETELHALQQGASFTTRLLKQTASPELEANLLTLFVDELTSLSDDQLIPLRSQWGKPPETIQVASAWPLTTAQQKQLENVLRDVTGLSVPVSYEQQPELLAGLCITIGNWIVGINLRDELKGFTEFAHVAR